MRQAWGRPSQKKPLSVNQVFCIILPRQSLVYISHWQLHSAASDVFVSLSINLLVPRIALQSCRTCHPCQAYFFLLIPLHFDLPSRGFRPAMLRGLMALAAVAVPSLYTEESARRPDIPNGANATVEPMNFVSNGIDITKHLDGSANAPFPPRSWLGFGLDMTSVTPSTC